MFSCSKVRRNKLHPLSKISADVFSLLYFKMSSHSQFLDLSIPEVLLGWRGCQLLWIHGSRRSLGLRPMANSMGVLPLKVTCLFLTVAALSINWAGVICARVVWCRFLEAVSTNECRETFLEQSYTHLRCMRSCRKSLHIAHSMECLHVVRMVESHTLTNRRGVHLELVHPLMNLSSNFRWRGTFARRGCRM